MTDLLSLTPDAARAALEQWLEERGEPAYRLRQVVPRLWQRPVPGWADATDLAVSLRTALAEAFPLERLTLRTHQVSSDGTEKFLWSLADGEAIESVLIPEGKRRTLCISSQAGCALGCVFCATGRMGFRRNLSPGEIAAQVREIVLRDPSQKPTNIVFMGMGEPLLNWDAVDSALSILNQHAGTEARLRAAPQATWRRGGAAAQPRPRHQCRLRPATGGSRGAAAQPPKSRRRGARSHRVGARCRAEPRRALYRAPFGCARP